MTVRNFDCVDVVNYPRFFYGSKMGTSTEKIINFENVTLPYASGYTDSHKVGNNAATENVLVRVNQAKGGTCGNYTMNFVNTYMDGVLLDAKSKAVLDETLTENTTMKYTFKTADNGYTPPQKQVNTVNYAADNKVYIGALLVHLTLTLSLRAIPSICPQTRSWQSFAPRLSPPPLQRTVWLT